MKGESWSPRKYPNGTSFLSIVEKNAVDFNDTTSPLYLSVASFNLLADCYVRPFDHRTQSVQSFAAFEWVQEDRWLDANEFRHPKLLEMLTNCHADVICLQELQLETKTSPDGGVAFIPPQWIQPLLSNQSYLIRLPPHQELQMIADRNQRVLGMPIAVTCAILVRNSPSSKWKIQNTKNGNPMDHKQQEASAVESVEDDTTTCVSAYLTYTDAKSEPVSSVIVFSVHLDATDEYKRVRQIEKCLQGRRQELQLHNTMGTNMSQFDDNGIMPIIIAGDMNTEMNPGSGVACFLSGTDESQHFLDEGRETDTNDDTAAVKEECALALRLSTNPTVEQLQEWNTMRRKVRQIVYDQCVRLARIDTGPTRSAYHYEKTCQMTSWKLDHMLYDSDTLLPLAVWETLEADALSLSIGLPNANCPSDHLPIGALFQMRELDQKKKQMVSQTRIQELAKRIELLLKQQQSERQNMIVRFDSELAQLEQSIAMQGNSDDILNDERKKKNKKPKGPPPAPIIDCLRQKRTTLRELGVKHQAERSNFVKGLDFMERRAIFHNTSAKTWIENGGNV